MPATSTAPTASGAEAGCPENRVKALDVLTWPRVGVPSPESPDRRRENRPRYDGKAVGTVLARYYDPATAQFLTVDPDAAITLSAYGYVRGNPLNASDPGGLTNDASSGGYGNLTSGPEAGCYSNLTGGPALCPVGGGQLAPLGSGVPGASWGRFLLGAGVVLTVGAVAEAAGPEVVASEAGAATVGRAASAGIIAAIVFMIYRSINNPGQSADEYPEGPGTLHYPTPRTPTPTPTPMMCPAPPYGPHDGPVP